MQPSVALPEDQDEIERVLDGKADLAYSMTFEVLPEIRARRLQDAEARAARRRRRRRSDRQGARRSRRAQHDVRRRGGPRGRRRRPRHDRFRRQDRRRGVRGRHRRGRAARARPGQLHPGLRGRPDGRQGGRGARRHGDLPGRLSGRRRWPARRRSSTSRSRRSRRPCKPAIDDEFAKTLGAESLDKLQGARRRADQARVRPAPRA